MKKFMLLHCGFETPTPEVMTAWEGWFESVADRTVEHGGFRGGREISRDGTRVLGMDSEAFTGYSIINAESLEQAESIAAENPFIASIRVYEIMER